MNAMTMGETTPLWLEIPEGQSFEEWMATGERLSRTERCLNWWIGDWWAAGSHRYGERAKIAAEGIFGVGFGALMNAASVCRAFETSRRREALSWSHHVEVAPLDAAAADAILDKAQAEHWSKMDIRQAVKTYRIEAGEIIPPEPRPPRTIDYIDDPWEMMVYRALWAAADASDDCPTCDDLADLIGCSAISTTVEIIQRLEAAGKIRVRRYQRSRQVFVVALGKWTREPENKAERWREQSVTWSALRAERPDETIEILILADKRGISLADYLRELIWLGWGAIQANPVRE